MTKVCRISLAKLFLSCVLDVSSCRAFQAGLVVSTLSTRVAGLVLASLNQLQADSGKHFCSSGSCIGSIFFLPSCSVSDTHSQFTTANHLSISPSP